MNKISITIKEGKRLAKIRLGRLPRPGYMVVIGGVYTGHFPQGRWDYELSLENCAGAFRFFCWERPFSTVDLSQFQTIEGERDNRS